MRAQLSATQCSKVYLDLRATPLESKGTHKTNKQRLAGTKPLQGYLQGQDRITNKQRPTFPTSPNQSQLQGLYVLSGIPPKTRNLLASGEDSAWCPHGDTSKENKEERNYFAGLNSVTLPGGGGGTCL